MWAKVEMKNAQDGREAEDREILSFWSEQWVKGSPNEGQE